MYQNSLFKTTIGMLRLSLLPFIAVFYLLSVSSSPTYAQDLTPLKTLASGLIIPKAVGMGMAGDSFENKKINVSFATKPKNSDFLKVNQAHLEKIGLNSYSKTKLLGIFTYSNDLGRAIHYGYDITYKATGKDQYRVSKQSITPFEPLSPRAEAYFVPVGSKTLNDMKSMSIAELLIWARENKEQVLPDVSAGPVKEYDVFCFSMDHLMKGAKWGIFSSGKTGSSWTKDGWHVAHIKATMALNGAQEVAFGIAHTRGKAPINRGKTFIIGGFSNQYSPLPPLPPVAKIETDPAVRKILDTYHAKNLPNLTTVQ